MFKVLFIGNSHTYFNDMVGMFKENCIKNNINVHVTMLSHGGKTLLWHSDEPEVRFNILYGDYDYIVLQDAAHPFAGEKSLMQGVKKIKEFIGNNNSKVLLYMTWTEEKNIENQNNMSLAYKNVAKETNSVLVPVGDYWYDIRINKPDINLYAKDGEHASELGSYITSKILYYHIFGEVFNINVDSIIEEFNNN